ncbi:MAG: RdgB/HAM1 family non-canonical purine NTP pyrophosphatase [Patescibacteria group bacterium]
MKLVFATHNAGKIIEMRAMLADLGFEVISADEAGVKEDVVEDGTTFEDNALKKARFVAEKSKEWAVADDSGVCIEALDGQPGVNTARWAGDKVGDDGLIRHTLEVMKEIPESKRQAYFESCVAVVSPTGEEHTFSGQIHGRLALAPVGTPRPKLPYDLIFIPNGHDRSFAQMSDQEKNSLSHRGLAFAKLKEFLKTI